MRLAATAALGSWFQCLGSISNPGHLQSSVEYLYRELLVHLDDPDSIVQDAVLGESESKKGDAAHRHRMEMN